MIFVTGATGYTGKYVVNALLACGESLRCLVRPQSIKQGLDRPDISLVQGDLEQPDTLENALTGCSAAIHVAHIRYAPAIIAACQKAGISRVVFFSSTWRFSKVQTPDVEAVLAGEAAIEASNLSYTIVRPSMIYGPGDDRNLSRLRAFLRNRSLVPVFGSGSRLVQPVYVADVADAAVGALWRTGAKRKIYTLAGPRPMPYGLMIDCLAQMIGRRIIKVHIPLFIAIPLVQLAQQIVPNFPVTAEQIRRMGEERAFDIADAQRELGFVPREFEEGIAEAIKSEND